MTTPTTADLARFGAGYIRRWTDWLADHPDADPALVASLMGKGEPPPDVAAQQAAADKRRRDVETAVNGVISGLSVMQRRFLVEYLIHGNASKAAESAGYSYPDRQGWRLRQNDQIRAAIDEFFHAQEMTAAEVVARLSQQAKAEYADYINPDGTVDLAQLKLDGRMHLVKKITQSQYGPQVEFYDAHTALVDVGRVHGIFTDKTDITSGGEPIVVKLEWGDNADA